VGKQVHLLGPNDSDTHVFTCVSHNGARKEVGIRGDEALLVHAEVSEELSILLEVLGKLDSWSLPDCGIIEDWILVLCQNFFTFEKTSLRNEKLDVIHDCVDHNVPVNCM